MRDLNKVLLIGRVGRRPEVRTTGKGVRLAVFSLATARRKAKVHAMSVAGAVPEASAAPAAEPVAGPATENEKPDWHQVVAWGTLARIVEDHLRVGQEVFIEGTVHNSSYMQTDDNGVKHPRKTSEVWADNIRFLGGVGVRVKPLGGDTAAVPVPGEIAPGEVHNPPAEVETLSA